MKGMVFMAQDRETVRRIIAETDIKEVKKVKDYLNKNPMANVMDVSTNTGVTPGTIMKYVNAGILKIKSKK
jgi:nucleosome binding factor SPN SPT16 subunit